MCIKEHPAYTFRDYSAILYLNGDFEGGNFVFTELDAKTITAEVRPQCGRMVGFSSGEENPHRVNAVTKGQRCAVATEKPHNAYKALPVSYPGVLGHRLKWEWECRTSYHGLHHRGKEFLQSPTYFT
ncbi:hypothetical protein XENTR_v10018970 [Xenopus tropicalis]|nr:hypothetical protein XENTR_v10018970 [Xenopus tropicalis]